MLIGYNKEYFRVEDQTRYRLLPRIEVMVGLVRPQSPWDKHVCRRRRPRNPVFVMTIPSFLWIKGYGTGKDLSRTAPHPWCGRGRKIVLLLCWKGRGAFLEERSTQIYGGRVGPAYRFPRRGNVPSEPFRAPGGRTRGLGHCPPPARRATQSMDRDPPRSPSAPAPAPL